METASGENIHCRGNGRVGVGVGAVVVVVGVVVGRYVVGVVTCGRSYNGC